MNTAGYNWQQIINIAFRHKREIILANTIAFIATFLSVPVPLLIPLLVDEVLLEQPDILVNFVNLIFPTNWHGPILTITAITLLVVILRLIVLGLRVWQIRQFAVISKDVIYRIRKDLIAQLQRVSMREYETLGRGQVVSHFVTDLDNIDRFLGVSIGNFLVAVLTILGVAAVLLWMHWQLAIIILLINPLVIYTTVKLGRKVRILKKKENASYADFQQNLTETLEEIQQIRAYNREQHYLGKVITSANQVKNHAIAYAWKSDVAGRLSINVFLLSFEILRAVGMLMVLFADLTIGQMFAVFGYLWVMLTPIQEIIEIQYSYHNADAALQRVNKLFTLAWEPKYSNNINPFVNKTTSSVQLKNISFSYNKTVLNDISLNIKAGEKVAFVGSSGNGKTTLVQILIGLNTPQLGEIHFDNVPITEIGMDTVRQNVIAVLQHPVLNGTLRSSLTMGREIADEKLWQAIEIAQLTEVVKDMQAGLDTILGQRGVRLSGGQQQRVAIARMILANPKVVILDEATSALDVETEAKLYAALNKFLHDKTTITIAHRLNTVKSADRIFVIDKGKIIEEGNHTNLLQQDGFYAKLYDI
ncbi:ABC transporter ATP-binding protein [Candidatus Halobeggiatoa sp. HSG11]|nr:ABC transporter ATP-binding protein [Candidatus Halobeggiatoa sp. HSG11]